MFCVQLLNIRTIFSRANATPLFTMFSACFVWVLWLKSRGKKNLVHQVDKIVCAPWAVAQQPRLTRYFCPSRNSRRSEPICINTVPVAMLISTH